MSHFEELVQEGRKCLYAMQMHLLSYYLLEPTLEFWIEAILHLANVFPKVEGVYKLKSKVELDKILGTGVAV